MLVVYVQLDEVAVSYFRSFPIDWAPAAYRERLEAKSHPAAYVQSVAGLWLLNAALGRAGHDTDLSTISFDAHDRPRLAQGPAYSVSHSDHFVACAVTQPAGGATCAGLDIEQPRALAPARIRRLACNDTERDLFAHQPERFFDYWCAREATVKATGRVGLKRIRQIQLSGNTAWLDGQCWFLRPLALASGLTACLSCDSPDERIQHQQVRPSLQD